MIHLFLLIWRQVVELLADFLELCFESFDAGVADLEFLDEARDSSEGNAIGIVARRLRTVANMVTE